MKSVENDFYWRLKIESGKLLSILIRVALTMSYIPSSTIGKILLSINCALLLVVIVTHVPMWQIEFGSATPSDGGGEHLLALLVGLPSLLVSSSLTLLCTFKQQWKSKLNTLLFILYVVVLISWSMLILTVE